SRFEKELATPGPHIPITANPITFRDGALLGARFIYLQTFGDRWLSAQPNQWKAIKGLAKVSKHVPEDAGSYPAEYAYDQAAQTLVTGSGVISAVDPAVFNFSLSGFKPVHS